MKQFEAKAVSCVRGKLHDAEIHFSECHYEAGEMKYKTVAKLIRAGLSSREQAMIVAKGEVEKVEAIIRSHCVDYLRKFKDAQP